MVFEAGALDLRGVKGTGLEKKWHQGAMSSPSTSRSSTRRSQAHNRGAQQEQQWSKLKWEVLNVSEENIFHSQNSKALEQGPGDVHPWRFSRRD